MNKASIFNTQKYFQNGFEKYVGSLGIKTYKYGNATHGFADILKHLKNGSEKFSYNILLPSFIPAKLYKTVLAYGYIPRTYQIDENCQFDINEIHALTDHNTKAILVVHYFGYPAKIRMLRELADEKNIILIEDCAHVIYARTVGGPLGTWGDFAIFSSRKMLNLPEGGYLVLNKIYKDFQPTYKKRVNSLYTFIKLLQTRGKFIYLTLTRGNDLFGVSKIPERGFIDYSRITQSCLKNISLLTSIYSSLIDIRTNVEKRQNNYSYLYNRIKEIRILKPLYNEIPQSWTPYSFPVKVKKGYRELLQKELVKAGISCGAGWPESPFEKRFNKTTDLAENLLEFPVHPFINFHQLNKLINVCKKFDESLPVPKKNAPLRMISSDGVIVPAIQDSDNGNEKHWFEYYLEKIFDDAKKVDNEFPSSTKILRTEVILAEDGFDFLKSEWEALCEKSDVQIFQTFDWQRLWWKYYGKDKQLYLILFYSEDNFLVNKLVGIAPLFKDTTYLANFRILNRLRFMGCGVQSNTTKNNVQEYGVSDYLDLIVHRGYEESVVKSFTAHLEKNFCDFDVLQLDEVYTGSVVFNYLLPQLKDIGWKYKIKQGEPCPKINLPENLNMFFDELSPKVRCQLKKIRKDLNGKSLFTTKEAQSQGELEKLFEEFVSLHQKRWNRIGLPGLFCDEKFRNFLKDVLNEFLRKGLLTFTAVYSQDKCLAVECGFAYKKYTYDYLKAFDDRSEFAKYRPGKALLLLLIEKAIENKIQIVDLLRGAEKYKFEFTSACDWTYKLKISNPVLNHRLRRSIFLATLFFVHAKRQTINQYKVSSALIKNYGLAGFIIRYIPQTLRKLKTKIAKSYSGNNLMHQHYNKKNANSLTNKQVKAEPGKLDYPIIDKHKEQWI